ncbi:NUDIX domain-containing protein [Arthrobacter yangruifuii]|uniref:NUDIX domain-containing protein n=1 Tax=Arthrobacter yangruifuii TaxID=2606616 RepID=A0A5N6MHS8_9MICC|nr:NUDIX domain-containing protein [Arthrobacter yangruifuii]KAD3633036.1 NUDIX domain-containing protein [Arthrobacter yangruifuii]
MTDRFSVVPASYLLFRRGGSVLLQLRQGTGYRDGYWATAAAGHVEAGESAVQAAVREAREELGIEVAPGDVVPLTAMHRSNGGGRPVDERVDFFFLCSAWQGEPRIQEPDKAARLEWFSLDDLPDAVVPHERYVLERLRTGLPPILAFGFADAIGGERLQP